MRLLDRAGVVIVLGKLQHPISNILVGGTSFS